MLSLNAMKKFKKEGACDGKIIWFNKTYAFYSYRTRAYMRSYAAIQHRKKDKNYLLYIQLLEN